MQPHRGKWVVQGVANRDLKLENLLLNKQWHDGMRPLVKICDFGYSKSELSSPARTSVGEWHYSQQASHCKRNRMQFVLALTTLRGSKNHAYGPWLSNRMFHSKILGCRTLEVCSSLPLFGDRPNHGLGEGTPIYVAPEILLAHDRYNPKVWLLSAMLLEFCAPF